ncbi:RNA-binding protein pno1 [Anaeramoeba ignava]|uniref:RNA-binding protein pno1 n=1 Tax=Anaeramoeba ignava TaxID=1746090 RepID=A0A9Q0LGX5_ANAIG|nr:RNA-binding protein pno1 [Anaeramoeba ignava]
MQFTIENLNGNSNSNENFNENLNSNSNSNAIIIQANEIEEEMEIDNENSNEKIDLETEQFIEELEPLTAKEVQTEKNYTKIRIPNHRLTPLRNNWMEIYTPIVEQMKLQIRYNPNQRTVELKNSEFTTDSDALQKAAEFIHAFCLGFELQDAIALLRLDDLLVESFDILEVRQTLQGDNLSRAIGRIVGKGGKTKYTIENATKTRISLTETKVHILGSYNHIKYARDAICDLILGSPPSKVYNKLRIISSRMKERF